MTTHYRIRDMLTESGVVLRLDKFNVVKETPCGYWVASEYALPHWDWETLKRAKYLRWVSKTGEKRYCYPAVVEAVRSFYRRKSRQLDILRSQLEQVEKCIKEFDKYKNAAAEDFNGGLRLGHTESPYSLDNLV